MSFWGRMFGSETRAANLRLSDPRLAEFFGVHGSSGNVTPDNVLSNLAVAASCVALRSELMASVSLFLFRRTEDGGRERASDNPLYGVLHDLANPNMTAFEARELMIRSLDLTGKPREMRVRLKGINSKTRVLSDGTKRTYWYAWKGGPRIEGEPGTPEFMVSYNAAVSAKVMPTQGVMLSIMQAFQADDAFRSLADSTKRDYVRYIKLIETAFGDFPLDALTDRLTRGELTAWRNTLALRSRRQADYAWSVLARILSWSLGRGLILANPCERGGRLYRAKRTVKVWTDDDEATFLARAPRHLHLPLSLALWTGQRQGDLIRLTWSAYDGKTFRLTQGKTGVRIVIPVGGPLRTIMHASLRRHDVILLNSDNRPWTSDGFRTSWGKARQLCGTTGLTFDDLRRPSRNRRKPLGLGRLHRTADRDPDRPLAQIGGCDPRQPLPEPRSGHGRGSDKEARNTNKTPTGPNSSE